MRGPQLDKLKVQQWREKAKGRRKEIERLNKRLQEVTAGRETWKQKAKYWKNQAKQLQKWQQAAGKGSLMRLDKAHGHRYPCLIICLSMWLRQRANCSLRSCRQVIGLLGLVVELNCSIPSHSTVRNWEQKLGYYRLHHCVQPHEGPWVLIADESIHVGQQRLLLLLAYRLSEQAFEAPLTFSDVQVLDVRVAGSWDYRRIGQRIEACQQRGYQFAYAVSDRGKALIKTMQQQGIIHIGDCTHALGGLLEKQYKTCKRFQAFSKQCGLLKQQLQNGRHAAWSPPTQRVKGRFLNLFALGRWAHQTLQALRSKTQTGLEEDLRGRLSWLEDYADLIVQIHRQCQTTKVLFGVLKTHGLSSATQDKCHRILSRAKVDAAFSQGVKQYLADYVNQVAEYEQVLCCSDIIESYFGKFKNRLSKNSLLGFTAGCLTLANFSEGFSLSETKEAMEQVEVLDVEQWANDNIPDSALKIRRKFFKNTG